MQILSRWPYVQLLLVFVVSYSILCRFRAMQNYGLVEADNIYNQKQAMLPILSTAVKFVVSLDGFFCLHFCFVSLPICFHVLFFEFLFSDFFLVVLFRRFFVLFVFRFSTTGVQLWYNVHNTKNKTRYARLDRRTELKRSRFRPRCEKVRSSPHVVLCR